MLDGRIYKAETGFDSALIALIKKYYRIANAEGEFTLSLPSVPEPDFSKKKTKVVVTMPAGFKFPVVNAFYDRADVYTLFNDGYTDAMLDDDPLLILGNANYYIAETDDVDNYLTTHDVLSLINTKYHLALSVDDVEDLPITRPGGLFPTMVEIRAKATSVGLVSPVVTRGGTTGPSTATLFIGEVFGGGLGGGFGGGFGGPGGMI